MNRKNTRLRNIPSEEYVSVASTSISDGKTQLSFVRSVLRCCMSMFIKPPVTAVFSCVRIVRGFMRGLSSLTCSKKQNSPVGYRPITQPSEKPSTKFPAPSSPQFSVINASTKTCPEESEINDLLNQAAAWERKNMIPGTYGRWCHYCQDYKVMAILERIGSRSSDADYIPRCATCGHILMPVKPDEEF